jgi:hypothetical protein
MSDQLAECSRDKDDELASSDLYSAEFIVDKKRGTYRGKKMMLYRVRWTGYTAADDTWEPIENLNDVLLSDFEETLKRRRPKQQSNLLSLEEDTPLVTWNDLLQILGSCPPEYLPQCLRPTPLPMVPCIYLDKWEKQPTIKPLFSSSDFSQNSTSSSGSNQRYAEESDSCPLFKGCLAGSPGRVAIAPFAREYIQCPRRPRLKKAAPSRSPLANVLMNY